MDDRHPRSTSRSDVLDPGSCDAPTLSSPRPSDWPAHPWVGLVDRFGRVRVEGGRGEASRVVVIWWGTPAGAQPVLLRCRIRFE